MIWENYTYFLDVGAAETTSLNSWVYCRMQHTFSKAVYDDLKSDMNFKRFNLRKKFEKSCFNNIIII